MYWIQIGAKIVQLIVLKLKMMILEYQKYFLVFKKIPDLASTAVYCVGSFHLNCQIQFTIQTHKFKNLLRVILNL